MKNHSPNWGGRRLGSGRKSDGQKRPNRTFRLSDAEYELVKRFIKELKEAEKMREVIDVYFGESGGVGGYWVLGKAKSEDKFFDDNGEYETSAKDRATEYAESLVRKHNMFIAK